MTKNIYTKIQNAGIRAGLRASVAFGLSAATLTVPTLSLAQSSSPPLNSPDAPLNLFIVPSLQDFAQPSRIIFGRDDYADPVDPHKVVFSTPGVTGPKWSYEKTSIHKFVSPFASVVDLPAHNFQAELLARIEKLVSQHGTLKEIVIDTHGGPDLLSALGPQQTPDPDQTAFANVFDLLSNLIQMQKDRGIKIANRIVFLGCDVMTDWGPEKVETFRHIAKALDAEIIGTTTIRWGNTVEEAGFARFRANGQIDRDYLDVLPSILEMTKKDHENYIRMGGPPDIEPLVEHSDTWFSCHQRKKPQEGAQCQERLSLQNIRSAELDLHSSKTPHDANATPNVLPPNLRLSSLGARLWSDIYKILNKEPIRRELSKGSTSTVQEADINTTQSIIEAAYTHGSASYDAAAVKAHEKFVCGLSMHGQAVMSRLVNDYIRQHPRSQSHKWIDRSDVATHYHQQAPLAHTS